MHNKTTSVLEKRCSFFVWGWVVNVAEEICALCPEVASSQQSAPIQLHRAPSCSNEKVSVDGMSVKNSICDWVDLRWERQPSHCWVQFCTAFKRYLQVLPICLGSHMYWWLHVGVSWLSLRGCSFYLEQKSPLGLPVLAAGMQELLVLQELFVVKQKVAVGRKRRSVCIEC